MKRQKILTLLMLTLLMIVTASTVIAHEGDEEARDAHREIVLRMVEETYNGGDYAVLSEILAPDYVYTGYTADGDTSAAGVQTRLEAYRAAMPDFSVTPELVMADGDWAAARLVYRGTFEQPLVEGDNTIEPNNEAVEIGHTVIYHFNEDDLIFEEFDSYDRLTELGQMGALPIPDIVADALNVVVENTSVTEGSTELNGKEEAHLAIGAAFVEAISAGDLDALDTTMADTYISYDSFGQLDREGLKATLATFHATAPDLVVTADALLAEGDWVGIRLIYEGTFTNEIDTGLIKVQPTGEPLRFAINVIARFNEDDLVVEDWRAFNRLVWLQQLGVLPTN